MNDDKYFALAMRASLRSEHKFKVGACVVVGKNAYVGWSRGTKTHSKSNQQFKSIHAEFDAINRALVHEENLKRSQIYVYRSLRSGTRGLAKPCGLCMDYIRLNGIKRVHFSDVDGFYSFSNLEG